VELQTPILWDGCFFLRNKNFTGRKFRKLPKNLSLCDFNSILTGQNIEKNGSLNIINKVQTEWSVMILAKKWKGGTRLKTEHEILEMAFYMFLEKGFSEVSTNEIIREAGLTKGGFYYCFRSREDLDQRVVERFIHPFFTKPVEKMQEVWDGKKQDIPTGELLWNCFFMPQRFVNFKEAIGKEVVFRNFYFLLYESMKKFPEVNGYYKECNSKKGEMLQRILERGQMRGEVAKNIDLENYVTMILAMQDGILALKVLDDGIDDEEKYKNIQKQMWRDISTESNEIYRDGGVTSAVS